MFISTYIVGLIGIKIWTTLFMFSFFFGLIFFAFVLLGALGHESDAEGEIDSDASFDLDADTDMDLDMHADLDTDLDLHADIDTDMHFDGHADFDSDLDLHADIDTDLNLEMDTPFESHIEFEHSGDVGVAQDSHYEEKSNYMMGNISSFMLIWGQIGWINSNNLNDLVLIYAFLGGFFTSKIFAWVITNYAKTVIVPIKHVGRGDIGIIIYGISPEKPGLVHVTRKDGVISAIIAKGAFGHDYFDKGEKGYVWTKEGELYTITKGLKSFPELHPKKPRNKKKEVEGPLQFENNY